MPHLILENKNLILFLNLKFNFMKRRGLIFNSRPNKTAVFACKRLRDSILSAFFHSYIFAMYKNEALWI